MKKLKNKKEETELSIKCFFFTLLRDLLHLHFIPINLMSRIQY
uniref:Uncharacterized protein n=1 Tax=Rhizophora mucronata TaxID=61149 RepID=A0A2P2J4I4_RHIMU